MFILLLLLYLFFGLFQIILGYVGIEYHLGQPWAISAVVIAFWLRIVLPLTIGTYFGIVDVIGWPWWAGLLIATPGIIFIVPAFVTFVITKLVQK